MGSFGFERALRAPVFQTMDQLASSQVRNAIAILLILISFGLLLPGLFQPLMTVEASVEFLGLKTTLFKTTRSVVETVDHLWKTNNHLVAILITTFSILVPLAKGLSIALKLTCARSELSMWIVFSNI